LGRVLLGPVDLEGEELDLRWKNQVPKLRTF